MANAVSKRNNTGVSTRAKFADIIRGPDAQKSIANVLTDEKKRDRYVTAMVTMVANNPALQECTFSSILTASLLGESLNLSHLPQLGQYYLVPFKNKKAGETTASFILGYRGYVQLALRSGYYKKLNVLPIKKGELVHYDPLTEEIEVTLIDDEEAREKAETIGYYAMFEYLNGFKKAIYWTKDKMLLHADKYSAAFSKDGIDIKTQYGTKHKVSFAEYEQGNYPKQDEWMYSSFWYKDFDGMAMKTMLRQLISKWGIMSIEMQDAISQDIQSEENLKDSDAEVNLVTETIVSEQTTEPAVESNVVSGVEAVQKVLSMDDL